MVDEHSTCLSLNLHTTLLCASCCSADSNHNANNKESEMSLKCDQMFLKKPSNDDEIKNYMLIWNCTEQQKKHSLHQDYRNFKKKLMFPDEDRSIMKISSSIQSSHLNNDVVHNPTSTAAAPPFISPRPSTTLSPSITNPDRHSQTKQLKKKTLFPACTETLLQALPLLDPSKKILFPASPPPKLSTEITFPASPPPKLSTEITFPPSSPPKPRKNYSNYLASTPSSVFKRLSLSSFPLISKSKRSIPIDDVLQNPTSTAAASSFISPKPSRTLSPSITCRDQLKRTKQLKRKTIYPASPPPRSSKNYLNYSSYSASTSSSIFKRIAMPAKNMYDNITRKSAEVKTKILTPIKYYRQQQLNHKRSDHSQQPHHSQQISSPLSTTTISIVSSTASSSSYLLPCSSWTFSTLVSIK